MTPTQKIMRPFLKKHIKRTSKVLDIGCGNKRFSHFSENTTTLDAWEQVNPDILLDVEKEKLPFKKNSFDYITMIDFIEHLEKKKGLELIEQCKNIVKHKIFLLTPLVWDNNAKNVENSKCWAYGNPYDYHKSLWTPEDFLDWTPVRGVKKRLWFGYWQKNLLVL